MAEKKVAPLPLSAVSMEEEEEAKHAPPADPPPPFPGVRHVIIWALLNAGHVAFSIAYALIMPSRPRPGPVEMTDTEVEAAVALAAGMLLCVVSQAAAGALALVLPRRRWRLRLFLSYAALVATAAGHCMWAGLLGMFVAEDGGLCFRTAVTTALIFLLLLGDLFCFRGLILRGGEEEE